MAYRLVGRKTSNEREEDGMTTVARTHLEANPCSKYIRMNPFIGARERKTHEAF